MDKEKLIKEFEEICGYTMRPHEYHVLNDVLALLKEQEAEPEIEGGGSTWFYVCSECRGAIDDNDRFCKHCGARLKRTVKRE